ncbi:hypothetical protein, partial [Streptobacillus notomytis]|uniref:hypothetical protein n=1 Tax=Streptobacillus notomytis TaxID=1712031 RepID=UPI000A69828C
TVFNLNNTYGYNLLDQENFKIFSDYIKNYGSGKYKDKKYTNLDNYIKKTSTPSIYGISCNLPSNFLITNENLGFIL